MIFFVEIGILRAKGKRKNVPFLEIGGSALILPQAANQDSFLLHRQVGPGTIFISSVCYVIAATKRVSLKIR